MKEKGHFLHTAAFFWVCVFFTFVALQWELKHRFRFNRRVRVRRLTTPQLRDGLAHFAALKTCRDPYIENFLEKHPLHTSLNRLWLVNSADYWLSKYRRELRRRGKACPPPENETTEAARQIAAELKQRRQTKSLLYEIDSLLGGYFGVFLEVRSLEFFLAWGRATRRRVIGQPLKKIFSWFCLFFSGILVPCRDSLQGRPVILPYENIVTLLKRARVARLQPCSCKTLFLTDKTIPRDTCMGFSYVEGMEDLTREGYRADFIPPAAVLDKLKQCEEYGMVHQIMTVSRPTGGKSYVLCNCTAEACVPLVLYLNYGIPMVRGSGLTVKISNLSNCLSCRKCVKRCIFSAICLEEDRPVLDEDKCLGCGLCISTCPAKIRFLTRDLPSKRRHR